MIDSTVPTNVARIRENPRASEANKIRQPQPKHTAQFSCISSPFGGQNNHYSQAIA